MNQNRKYLGMTGSQIGILAALAGALLLILCLGGWFIFGGGFNFSSPPENTPVPQSTPTLIVIPTFTPTVLPTSIPYEQLIPTGWKQHKTALIEIWLPSEFRKSESNVFLVDPTNPAVSEIQLATNLSNSSLYRMVVGIFYEPLTAEALDAFLDRDLPKLPPEVRVTERRNDLVNSTPVVRLLLEQRIENVDVNILVFVFLDGGTIWYVEYGAQINQFYEQLGTFEDSVQTFRVVR